MDQGAAGTKPRASGRPRQQAPRQASEQAGLRTVCGERQTDPAGGFAHRHGDLQQPQTQRVEVGIGQPVGRGNGLLCRVHQSIGRHVQEQPLRLILDPECSWLAMTSPGKFSD